VEDEARSRLGAAEADAFLTRLETLSFDITGPLGLLYGDVTDVGKLTSTRWTRPPRARPNCGASTAAARSTRPGSSGPA
jgi:hypothetical protein